MESNHTVTQDKNGLHSSPLIEALGNFATGVTVITTLDKDGGYIGVTASSFNSVSLDPPLILWSLDKNSYSLPSFVEAQYFIVNVLTAEQSELSKRFAMQGNDKFSGLDVSKGIGGVPMLSKCAARFQCKLKYVYEGGDHFIIVGEVQHFDSEDASPLLYHKGEYKIAQSANMDFNEKQKSTDDAAVVDDLLLSLLGRAFHQLHHKRQSFLASNTMAENDWRILAALNTRPLNRSQLADYTEISMCELNKLLRALSYRDMIVETDDSYFSLTENGKENLAPLMASVKAEEQDMLGKFKVSDVQILKLLLKQLIDWSK
jgi:3-hydroxy-9,10-secoandrosta-1,3,5(10)-triene-9,17-dione monooxygenase reductase component